MSAKDIILRQITAQEGNETIRRLHYSGRVVNNSQLHIGVFFHGKLEGAVQFGPSMDKRKTMRFVKGVGWNEFIELNRLAFSEKLPRNSESRAISICIKIIRRIAPHIKFIVSYADATSCGDGTIYRAAGFFLTGITTNKTLWYNPHTGEKRADLGLRLGRNSLSRSSMKPYRQAGWYPLKGYQIRYIYLMDPALLASLAVPILPYSKIKEIGAAMYKGRAAEALKVDAPGLQPGEGGANPTSSLR